MFIVASVKNVSIVEEWHVCAICCKMINLNREPHNRVYILSVKGFLFSHAKCDTIQPLKLKKP